MVLKWEVIESKMLQGGFLTLAPAIIRAKVPGGWLVHNSPARL